ncbi:MAG TPA: hypothetical protein VNL71_08615 [Chloroflexota bacterium]|nr:hypothetical protein [Chloroflexota bacterium]
MEAATTSSCASRHAVVFANQDYASSQASITAIACATEDVRGLTPHQPIIVKLVDSSSLRAEAMTIRQRDVAAEPLAGTELAFELLGALAPNQDLAAIRRSQYGGNTTAQYDVSSKTLYVRNNKPAYTPLDRAFIAHEFARALLDQNFNLANLVSLHGDSAGHNSDAQLAAEALVEGDAFTTMTNFAITTFDRQDILLLNQQLQSGASSPNDFPHDQIGFPSTQGTTFVRYLMQAASNGKKGESARDAANRAIDNAMQHPPTSTKDVLNPASYVQHHAAAPEETIDPLHLGSGWTEVDSDVLGAFGIGDLLSQHAQKPADTTAAQQAGAGWQADRWVVYKSGSDSLMIWKCRFTSPAAAQAYVRALSSYTAARFHATLATQAPLVWHTTGYALTVRARGAEIAVAMGSTAQSADLLGRTLAGLGFS